jgi:hypothetical protein
VALPSSSPLVEPCLAPLLFGFLTLLWIPKGLLDFYLVALYRARVAAGPGSWGRGRGAPKIFLALFPWRKFFLRKSIFRFSPKIVTQMHYCSQKTDLDFFQRFRFPKHVRFARARQGEHGPFSVL